MDVFRSIKEINRLLIEINRLLSEGINKYLLEKYCCEKVRNSKLRFSK